MTRRLYHENAYTTEFEAKVLSCEGADGAFRVLLDGTAFYPTGGGQPFDVGVLGDARVLDVLADNGDVVHVLDKQLEVGAKVAGRIDWARRFEHMQQHAADHILAGYIHRLYGGFTVGLHLGAEVSTIDVIMPDGATHLTEEQVARLEDLVNADIQRDLPIRCFFPSADELETLPLRKDPTVSENIRVVLIGDAECVACGGTHPSSTGQIGLMKIVSVAPSRGKMRVTFLAGARAMKDYQTRFQASARACGLLSTQPEQLPEQLEALLAKTRDLEHERNALHAKLALTRMDEWLRNAPKLENGWTLLSQRADDLTMDALKELAKRLLEKDQLCALLQSGTQLLFVRSAKGGPDMGKLLRETCAAHGGRGGGRADFAQGAVADAQTGALGFAAEKLADMSSDLYCLPP